MTKRCTKCGEVKPLTSFGVSKSWCKPCVAAYTRAWKQRNPAKAREIKKRWLQTESGKISNRASNRRYRERNLGKVREYRRRWGQTERGQASCQRASLKWLAKHPDASLFAGSMVSLDALHSEALYSIADKSGTPLESLIQAEAICRIINRVVSERGLDYYGAYQLIHSYL